MGIHQKFKSTNKLHYNDLYRFKNRERAAAMQGLVKAKKLVSEDSPTYKAAIEAKNKGTEQKKKDEMEERGKALAKALEKRFEDVLKAGMPAGPPESSKTPATTPSSPTGPTGASPKASYPFPLVPPSVGAVRREVVRDGGLRSRGPGDVRAGNWIADSSHFVCMARHYSPYFVVHCRCQRCAEGFSGYSAGLCM